MVGFGFVHVHMSAFNKHEKNVHKHRHTILLYAMQQPHVLIDRHARAHMATELKFKFNASSRRRRRRHRARKVVPRKAFARTALALGVRYMRAFACMFGRMCARA